MSTSLAHSGIEPRREEVISLVQIDLDRAQRRLLDFVSDFGDAEDRREAIVVGVRLSAHLRDERVLGRSPETTRQSAALARSMLELTDAVAERSEASSSPSPTPSPAPTGGAPDLRIVSPRDSTDAPEAEDLTDLERERERFRSGHGGGGFEPEAAYVCNGIGKSYGRRFDFELKDVALTLRPGEITGVVGVNGAGKTTILRIVAGELLPDSGDYAYPMLNPESPTPRGGGWAVVRRQIGYVEQRPPRWFFSTLAEHLYRAAAAHGLRGRENVDEVDFFLQRLGLARYRDATWNQISGGFKMRFELARVLVTRPRMLVLDEPLAPLDIVTQKRFLQDLRDLARSARRPLAVILSSQHLYELEEVADRVLVIKDGVPIFNDRVDALGADRTENLFELGCDAGLRALEEIFGREFEVAQPTAEGFLVRAPLTVSSADVLTKLLAKRVTIEYFRDVSRSTRAMFEMGDTAG